ncbi:MAG: PKD domain-containing protein, partial [Bryobacteraceae bacterium]
MSHEVKVTWAGGTNQTPVVNAGPDQAITLPASAQLTGTVTDDGLPVGAALTITWSKVSGPGDVAFLNASQPATSASFSAAGTYVLKIQATDSLLVGEDTVTVTVNGSPAVTQGWFESPLDGARVSGLTPIRVIPSVTLTSGTLSYWAASASEASATVLNANTTGTGQIGTLDSTVLANGSYWIKLAATNTVPVTQTNLLLVTVSGEDKPGRMMSTITDFTAPLAGLPIQIQRSYDSLERGISGDFG